MMKRFLFLTSASATMILPRPVLSASEDFYWRKPGAFPYRGNLDEALRHFADLVPHSVLERLHHLTSVDGSFDTTIPDGYRFTRMLFGNGDQISNVVAATHVWPKGASRAAKLYKAEQDGVAYGLFRPRVCGNWSIRKVTYQGECIPDDHVVCTPQCQAIRRAQE